MANWADKSKKVPSENPVITREVVDQAAAVLAAAAMGHPHPETGEAVTTMQAKNAESLVKLYQTQDRFTPERLQELARMPKASENIRNLANLTDEELNERTLQMLGKTA